jgi:hypothetical protein
MITAVGVPRKGGAGCADGFAANQSPTTALLLVPINLFML